MKRVNVPAMAGPGSHGFLDNIMPLRYKDQRGSVFRRQLHFMPEAILAVGGCFDYVFVRMKDIARANSGQFY